MFCHFRRGVQLEAWVLGSARRPARIRRRAGIEGGLTRLIANQLYGVAATHLLTIAIVVLVLTAIAMLACVIPARLAANAEPLKALRVE